MNCKHVETATTLLIVIIIITPLFQTIKAQSLKITIMTDKQSYNLGDDIQISGNLSFGYSPVINGQVAIQVVNSLEETVVLRVLPTGSTVMPPYLIEILEVVPCDKNGNPKDTFQPGVFAYFKVIVRNNDGVEHNAIITLNFFDSTNTPFDCTYLSHTFAPQTEQTLILPGLIPSEIPTGTANVYVNAFSAFPNNNGRAYCPEKNGQFKISSGSEVATPPNYPEGEYVLKFKMPKKDVVVGTYTAYAVAYYQGYYNIAETTFQVILVGDVNHDGKVDMKDVGIVVKAFGSTPENPKWTPITDVNHDGKVDMKDVGIVVADFGKTCIYTT